MSNTVLTETFLNFSSTEWNLDRHGYLEQKLVGNITKKPHDHLSANSGSETYEYEQDMLGSIADGCAEVYCCWNNGKERFGVRLKAGTQVLGMGNKPHWYVMNDTNPNGSSHDINWVEIKDAADNYEWPSSIGFRIDATPDSHHSTLAVKITVQNL